VLEVDGHDPAAVQSALAGARAPGAARPRCIVAHTVKGKGVGYMELSRTWHLGYLAPADAADTVRELDQHA
jgi:transketolase